MQISATSIVHPSRSILRRRRPASSPRPAVRGDEHHHPVMRIDRLRWLGHLLATEEALLVRSVLGSSESAHGLVGIRRARTAERSTLLRIRCALATVAGAYPSRPSSAIHRWIESWSIDESFRCSNVGRMRFRPYESSRDRVDSRRFTVVANQNSYRSANKVRPPDRSTYSPRSRSAPIEVS